jgi:hypothetical protein
MKASERDGDRTLHAFSSIVVKSPFHQWAQFLVQSGLENYTFLTQEFTMQEPMFMRVAKGDFGRVF